MAQKEVRPDRNHFSTTALRRMTGQKHYGTVSWQDS